jgi:hypothetical protein
MGDALAAMATRENPQRSLDCLNSGGYRAPPATMAKNGIEETRS